MDGIDFINESCHMETGAMGAVDFVVLADGRIIIVFTAHIFPSLVSAAAAARDGWDGNIQQLFRSGAAAVTDKLTHPFDTDVLPVLYLELQN